MATTLPNMGLVQPTPGGDSGTWDDTINDNLETLDAHRHEAGNGLRIRPAGMDINADLTFNSLWAPKDLHRITFASIVALTSNNKSLFVNTSDNELYWRSNTGTNVKLTAGNALNVAAFTGGFGAGYTSASAAADYDDSSEQYTFKQAAAGNWARLGVGGIRLYEFGTSETLRVGLLAPAALASSYDITLPLAAPSSTAPLTMSSSGVIEAGASRKLMISPLPSVPLSSSGWNNGAFLFFAVGTAGSVPLLVPIPLHVGDRLLTISYEARGDAAADLTTTVYTSAAGVNTSIGTATENNVSATWGTFTVNVTDTTVTEGTMLNIEFLPNAANIRIGNITVTYDHP